MIGLNSAPYLLLLSKRWRSHLIGQILKIFVDYFFEELEFLKLKFHDKLNFYKLEFQKYGRPLHISKQWYIARFFAKYW